ncbi:acyl-CoA carboxylase epsilon subunit [Streptomyces sp. 4N124]|uniref:acyl-CoA carboxylase epsilon subunit n=1 Tax=Streptomyces sp. 4N124 TaxID=3457420 RepID=UPI003FCEF0DA
MESGEALLRVERGQVSDEELAALTAVLLALYGAGQEMRDEPPVAGCRWWRRPDAYAAPGSWR